MDEKNRVLIVYGGRSAEHEIACRSAAFILKNIDHKKYDVSTVAINKEGKWLPQDTKRLLAETKHSVPIHSGPATNPVKLIESSKDASKDANSGETVVFPVLHGTFGEDGTIQGMFDLANIAYVGADTLGSAIGMDKLISKKLVEAAGIRVVPYLEAKAQFWAKDGVALRKKAVDELGLPLFVKPSRLGSSVGISKVKKAEGLEAACQEAFQFDDKIMIEKGLSVREIEFAVLGDYDPEVSVPGEIVTMKSEFYDYNAKYFNEDDAHTIVPAKMEPHKVQEGQAMAKHAFQVLELYGMARVDLFLDKNTNLFYFNEVNTIPGLTASSLYPVLWQASGIPPTQLIDRLIALAIARQHTKNSLKREK